MTTPEREDALTENTQSYKAHSFAAWLLRLPVIRRSGLAAHPMELTRFLKFAFVGVVGMVVDLSVLTGSKELLRLPLPVAVALGFSFAVVSNFAWNRIWTFPESRERPIAGQLMQFTIVNLVGLGINELVVLSLHPGILRLVLDPFAYLAAKVVAIGIVLFWNYFANRAWTYRGIE